MPKRNFSLRMPNHIYIQLADICGAKNITKTSAVIEAIEFWLEDREDMDNVLDVLVNRRKY